MPIKILMPALSPTMQEGNLIKWFKLEGDKVSPGDVIAEIETDKATMEVDAVDEGIMGKIFFPAGSQNVLVGSLIAVLYEEGEDKKTIDSFLAQQSLSKPAIANLPGAAIAATESAKLAPAENVSKESSNPNNPKNDARIFASPLAKRIASEQGINLNLFVGSGPSGRIVKSDLLNLPSQNVPSNQLNSSLLQPRGETHRDVPTSNIRKIIAKRLCESKQTIPHFYLTMECNVDKLLEARQQINSKFSQSKISVNDLIILATAKALKKVPEANASWHESFIRYYQHVDISIAVAIDGGLITPIVKDADRKDIFTLSNEMKILVKKARDNRLTPEEFQGGNFSISNLGMYGVKNFNAIINPPQSCILAIGASIKKPIIVDDQIRAANMMEVTLSSDHRVVDGVIGAWFLSAFKEYIEHPVLMLMQS